MNGPFSTVTTFLHFYGSPKFIVSRHVRFPQKAGRRRRSWAGVSGHFQRTSPLTACKSCVSDHQWQGLHAVENNARSERCGSRIRQQGAWCDEFEREQVQHLCWIPECDTLFRLVRWCDNFCLSGRRLLCNAFRDRQVGKALVGQDDRCDGTQCWNGRFARSNPPEQNVETASSWRRGRRVMGGRGRPLTHGNHEVTHRIE